MSLHPKCELTWLREMPSPVTPNECPPLVWETQLREAVEAAERQLAEYIARIEKTAVNAYGAGAVARAKARVCAYRTEHQVGQKCSGCSYRGEP